MTTQSALKRRRKARTVKVSFREKLDIVAIDNRGSWHSSKSLKLLREAAVDMGRQARKDRRLDLWNATFQDPVSHGLLCMWTTHSHALRGLEKLVSLPHRQQRITEQRQLVKAVMFAHRHEGKVCEELAEVSRTYSHASRRMAEKVGKADEFAVAVDAVDEMKANRVAYIQALMTGTLAPFGGCSLLPALPKSNISLPSAASPLFAYSPLPNLTNSTISSPSAA
jgi:hypothetical protein